MGKVFVYVMASPTATKVGIAQMPGERRKAVQYKRGEPVGLVWVAEFGSRAEARMVEASAHFVLDDYAVGGEWFSVSPAAAISAVLSCTEVTPDRCEVDADLVRGVPDNWEPAYHQIDSRFYHERSPLRWRT